MNIISLLETLVNTLFEAEGKFFKNPKDFYSLEKAAKASTEAFAAGFLGEVLSSVNKHICDSSWRNNRYNIQRTDTTTVSNIFYYIWKSNYSVKESNSRKQAKILC